MRDDPSPWRKARTVVKLKGRGIGGLAAWSGVARRRSRRHTTIGFHVHGQAAHDEDAARAGTRGVA